MSTSAVESTDANKSLAALSAALVENARQRITIASIRSLFSCMGIGETTPFDLPAQHQLVPRMKHNLNYFLTNYLLLALCVFAFLLLFFHPVQLIVCVLVAWCWFVVLTRKPKDGVDHYVIFGRKIGEQELLLLATSSTIIFLVFFLLPTVLFSLSTSIVASAAHALLRNNRLKDDDTFAQYPLKSQGPIEGEDQV